jgi:dUTP pyrophosphatase
LVVFELRERLNKHMLSAFRPQSHRSLPVSIPSVSHAAVKVIFFRNAATLYGDNGLAPATAVSAGTDLRACPEDDAPLIIPPGGRLGIGSGIAVEPLIPGIAGFVYSRSGLGAVKGLAVAQGVGLVDPDYRGEIRVFLLNTGYESYTVQPGERIAQLVFQPYLRPVFQLVDALGETARGAGGFGHTGNR